MRYSDFESCILPRLRQERDGDYVATCHVSFEHWHRFRQCLADEPGFKYIDRETSDDGKHWIAYVRCPSDGARAWLESLEF